MQHYNKLNEFLARLENIQDNRDFSNLHRRLLKLSEECGEVSEAYLVYSSDSHYKEAKYKEDIVEELVDILIVAFDCIHTIEENHEKVYDIISEIGHKKLDKWEKHIKKAKELADKK